MKLGRWRCGIATTMVVMLLALPLQASAEETFVADGNAWSKFFDLAGCAVGVATIADGLGLVLAGIACGKAASEWWTE
jgi:hypothetical protein